MDYQQKTSILTQLAREGGGQAKQVLQKEANKIQAALVEATRFDVIDNQLNLLEVFAVRVPQKSFVIADNLLKRLESMEVTYSGVSGVPDERLKALYSKEKLIVKVLGFMAQTSWADTEANKKCFRILLENLDHENELVRKEAKAKIETIAEYHLHLYRLSIGDDRIFGPSSQFAILGVLDELTDAELKKYFDGICIACKEILSPTMEGTDQTYDKFVFQTAALPASDVADIRIKAIHFLKKIYGLVENTNEKEKVISTLSAAFERPRTSKVVEDIHDMISADTKLVLDFLLEIISSEQDLLVVQKIEHISFWRYYHAQKEEVKTTALAIKAQLDGNEGYQTFKVLVGYQGIFREWKHHADEKEDTISDDFKQEELNRNAGLQRLLDSVTDETQKDWEGRILKYAAIQSNDGATFPFFMRFLESLGEKCPDFALNLLSRHAEELENFMSYILWNLYKSEKKIEAQKLISKWIAEGRFLRGLAFVLGRTSSLDDRLFQDVCVQALNQNDLGALSQIAQVLVANYSSEQKDMIGGILAQVVCKFSEHKNPNWVMEVWFQKELRPFVQDADEGLLDSILENLLYLERVGHEVESLLVFIAERFPEKVWEFFGKRTQSKKENELGIGYDAFPYEFYKLDKALTLPPQRAIEIVREWYDGNYSLFIYRGAKFLSLIYPDFPRALSDKMIECVRKGDEENRLFVLAVLRNYNGNPNIHNVCKELVKMLPVDSHEYNEVSIVLQEEGVVEGDYGFVQSYQRKKEEIQPWLSDENERVKSFAQQYIIELNEMISRSQKRSDEQVALRKFKYGAEEDISDK